MVNQITYHIDCNDYSIDFAWKYELTLVEINTLLLLNKNSSEFDSINVRNRDFLDVVKNIYPLKIRNFLFWYKAINHVL